MLYSFPRQYLKKIYSKTFRGKIYLLLRWMICPFERMECLVPKKGTILDIGCGEGVFANFLAMASSERKVFGIDRDTKKINIALTTVLDRGNIYFLKTDALNIDFTNVDSVILSDFLHHINFEQQNKILGFVYKILKPGGILLIKEVDRKFDIRFLMSLCSEFLIYFKKGFFKSKEKIMEELRNKGFTVKMMNLDTIFGSTIIFLATK